MRESKVLLGHCVISSNWSASDRRALLTATGSLGLQGSAVVTRSRELLVSEAVASPAPVSGGSYSQVSSSSPDINSTSMRPRSSSELSLEDFSLPSSDMLMLSDCFRSLLFFSQSAVLHGDKDLWCCWLRRSCLFCSSSCRTLSLSSRISSWGSSANVDDTSSITLFMVATVSSRSR